MTLSRYKRACNAGCLAFAFPRNPYDRLVSAFEYLKRGGMGDRNKPARGDYRSYYCRSSREIVGKTYRRDLEMFNYEAQELGDCAICQIRTPAGSAPYH
jgi:hypothetical protein